MRPLVLLGLLLTLSGCTGFGAFLEDTHTFRDNPNAPTGDSENLQRARGVMPAMQPLTPEPGNIWPTTLQSEPTLLNLEQQGAQPEAPLVLPNAPAATGNGLPPAPHPQPRPQGSSTSPGNALPPLGPAPAPAPAPRGFAAPAQPGGPGTKIYQTPSGPAIGTGGTSGYGTTISPGGGSSIVVPNGNGTSTIIHPDGTVETVPTPK